MPSDLATPIYTVRLDAVSVRPAGLHYRPCGWLPKPPRWACIWRVHRQFWAVPPAAGVRRRYGALDYSALIEMRGDWLHQVCGVGRLFEPTVRDCWPQLLVSVPTFAMPTGSKRTARISALTKRQIEHVWITLRSANQPLPEMTTLQRSPSFLWQGGSQGGFCNRYTQSWASNN
jgi:hypothetical protein